MTQGHQPSRRTGERYVGQLRRETGTRFKFRQAAPAPLYAEDRRSTDQALLARLLRLDPVMPLTYNQVQAFCRMLRQRHSDDFDAWITEGQHTGVKELRAFVKGLLKDAAAVRARLSLVWSNGPTEGFIHRLKRLKRQAYGRAGVVFLRRRMLATSSGEAA